MERSEDRVRLRGRNPGKYQAARHDTVYGEGARRERTGTPRRASGPRPAERRRVQHRSVRHARRKRWEALRFGVQPRAQLEL